MFHFELREHRPNHEEYDVYLPAGVPRKIVVEVTLSDYDETLYQQVGFLIISRLATARGDDIILGVHPDLTEEERGKLLLQVEGLCGRHSYGAEPEEFYIYSHAGST